MFSSFLARFDTTDPHEAVEKAVDEFLPETRDVVGRDGLSQVCEKKVRVCYAEDVPFEGRLERERSGTYRITIRQGKSEHVHRQRLRFTLAHELGHWIAQHALDQEKANLFRGMPVTDEEVSSEESLADLLAAEILMPQRLMTPFLQEKIDHGVLGRGVDQFNVSQQAFVCRYAALSGNMVVYLKLTPAKYRHPDSPARVDDSWVTLPSEKPQRLRGETYLADEISFAEIGRRSNPLRVVLSKKVYELDFCSKYRFGIVPKVTLLGASTVSK